MKMNAMQRRVMKHALGLNRSTRLYRNYYAATPGSVEHDVCLSLVALKYMYQDDGSTGSNSVFFYVTAKGRAELLLEENREGRALARWAPGEREKEE